MPGPAAPGMTTSRFGFGFGIGRLPARGFSGPRCPGMGAISGRPGRDEDAGIRGDVLVRVRVRLVLLVETLLVAGLAREEETTTGQRALRREESALPVLLGLRLLAVER